MKVYAFRNVMEDRNSYEELLVKIKDKLNAERRKTFENYSIQVDDDRKVIKTCGSTTKKLGAIIAEKKKLTRAIKS